MTQVAQPRELQLMTVAELMQDQGERIDAVCWRLVSPDHDPSPEVGWMASHVPGQYTVGQLYHPMIITYEREVVPARRRFKGNGRLGLEFRVVTASGRRAIIASADDVRTIFRARSANHNPLKNSRGLLDAMREQSDHQVGLDMAML